MRGNFERRLSKIEAVAPGQPRRVFTLTSDAGDSGALDRFIAENDIDPDDPNVFILHWTIVRPLVRAQVGPVLERE